MTCRVCPNLYRNVIPARPDAVWVGDITYIRIATGFFSLLAAVLDACSRKVVGYAISRQTDTQLTLAALRRPWPAADHRPVAASITRIAAASTPARSTARRSSGSGLLSSVSSPANPYHNAQATGGGAAVKTASANPDTACASCASQSSDIGQRQVSKGRRLRYSMGSRFHLANPRKRFQVIHRKLGFCHIPISTVPSQPTVHNFSLSVDNPT